MSNNHTSQMQEISEIRNHVEWLDGERRKSSRKVAELEQKLILQERQLSGRKQRIRELEKQSAKQTAKLQQLSQFDGQLGQFKDDIVGMIEQYDQRRINAEQEIDRLRRIEHEGLAREISNIRKELPVIPRIQQDMELRKTEEVRLATLIGNLKVKFPPIDNRVEESRRSISFLEEKERQNRSNIADIQTQIMEINARWEGYNARLDTIGTVVSKFDVRQKDFVEEQEELRKVVKNWTEQIQIGEHNRNQKLDGWRSILDNHTDSIERYAREWIRYSDQYKEAKMVVDTIGRWQRQIEQQQREATELLRVETNRLQARWDEFLLDNTKSLKQFRVDIDQRWASTNRTEKQAHEKLLELEERLILVKEEKDLLTRVQAAQVNAIRKFPNIWIEEVEKAKAQDPNRRRQPALTVVPEELV